MTFPATASIYCAVLMQIATWQVYNFTNFFNKGLILDKIGNEPINDQFNTMGYGSKYIVQNLGTLCFTIFAVPLFWFSFLILNCFSKKRFGRLFKKSRDLMFYNSWIAFFNENYMFLCACAAINFNYLLWNTPGNAFNSLLTLFVGTVLFAFLTFLPWFYLKRKSYILAGDEAFFARFGSAIEDLNFFW